MAQGERRDETFTVGDTNLAAWFYRAAGTADLGDPAPCVVMGHGFSLTRHDGLTAYAEAFSAAGCHVLVFDHRYLGDSGGEPRQRFRAGAQRADWRGAITHAGTLPEVDQERIVLWGYSFGGGHVARLMVDGEKVAAAMVLCPFVDGARRVAATRVSVAAWILPRSVRDALGSHTTIPVTGPEGSRGAMTLAGEGAGFAAAVPPGSPWRNEISPAILLTLAFQRPVARARRIGVPLWVGRGDRDISVHGQAVQRLAERAPRAELHHYDSDHFEVLVGDLAYRVAADQADFLRRIFSLR